MHLEYFLVIGGLLKSLMKKNIFMIDEEIIMKRRYFVFYVISIRYSYRILSSSSAMRARASFLPMRGPSCPERRIHQRFL